jgi:hypothetical protein
MNSCGVRLEWKCPNHFSDIAEFRGLDPDAVITPVNLEVMGKDATSVDQEG